MDHETEMIRQQMDDTRTSLTDKLEVLERQGMDMVQGASSAVTKTVENVKDMFRDTVQTAKDSMQETVEAVKDAFDLKRQVDRRPWTIVAGATALGFLGGYLVYGRRAGQPRESGKGASTAMGPGARTAVARNGASEGHDPVAGEPAQRTTVAARDKPGVIATLGDTFHEEISQLKGLAVGTLLGLVRDMVSNSVSEPMEQQLREVIDGITVKLGGKPIHGRLLPKGLKREHLEKVEDQQEYGSQEQSGLHAVPPSVLRSRPAYSTSSA